MNIKYIFTPLSSYFFPGGNSGDPPLTTRSMEFLDFLHPFIITIFIAVSSVVFTYVLQQKEHYNYDSAPLRRVDSQPFYMPSWPVQLPGRVPKSPLQPSISSLRQTRTGIFYTS
jgi:hypothetical protein